MSSEQPKLEEDTTLAKQATHSFAEGGVEADLTYTPEDEGRIKKKIDRYLLPMLAIMYLISYLDRSNSKHTSRLEA